MTDVDAAQKSADTKATWSMALGLASILCTCFTAIPAVILGLIAHGQASPAGKTKAKIGIATGMFFTMAMVVLGAVSEPAPPRTSTSSSTVTSGSERAAATERKPSAAAAPKPAPKPKYEIEVDAVTLWKAYDANEVAADDKFKGKKLLVSGIVQSIDKDIFDSVVLKLKSPNEFMATSARLESSEKSKAAQLRKGQSVKLICTGQGSVIGSPSLGDCVFN